MFEGKARSLGLFQDRLVTQIMVTLLERQELQLSSVKAGKRALFLAFPPEVTKQRFVVSKIRNDEICTGLDQSVSFPGVGPAASSRLISRKGHAGTANRLDVFYLYIAVAEANQDGAIDLVLTQNPFNHQPLRRALVVRHSTVDFITEENLETKQFHLFPDVFFIGSAGKV